MAANRWFELDAHPLVTRVEIVRSPMSRAWRLTVEDIFHEIVRCWRGCLCIARRSQMARQSALPARRPGCRTVGAGNCTTDPTALLGTHIHRARLATPSWSASRPRYRRRCPTRWTGSWPCSRRHALADRRRPRNRARPRSPIGRRHGNGRAQTPRPTAGGSASGMNARRGAKNGAPSSSRRSRFIGYPPWTRSRPQDLSVRPRRRTRLRHPRPAS